MKLNRLISILFVSSSFCYAAGVLADTQTTANTIVPAHEHKIAQDKKLAGPDKSQGITSVTTLGSLDLGKDFPAMQGQQFRAREIVIEPGGIVAVHEHDSRPGVAYILEGEIIEHRSDRTDPVQHQKGSVAFENSGVAHWWENKSTMTVKALVVDILPLK